MRSKLKFTLLSLFLLASFAVMTVPVAAATSSLKTQITGSEPTFNRFTSPNCAGISSNVTYYQVFTVNVSAPGNYKIFDNGYFHVDPTAIDAELGFFTLGGFDPAHPQTNCVTSGDDTTTLTFPAAGEYTLVLTPFHDHAIGNINYDITGPGTITVITTCSYPLPSSGAGVLSIPNDTPAYFSPDSQSGTNFSIPAGTWWITDVSGDFAQVWISCEAQPVWVLKSAIVGDLSNVGVKTVDLLHVGLARSEGDCPYILPGSARVASLPNGAPAYFAPDLQDGTNFSIPSGQWWVVTTYGDFSELWISCQAEPVWVLTNTLAQ